MGGIAFAASKVKPPATEDSSFFSTIPLFGLVMGVPYFAPTIVGYMRKKDNKTAILMLNLFLGWTVVGWVVALVWAVSKDKAVVQNIYVQQAPPAS